MAGIDADPGPVIWSDRDCLLLNAHQHNHRLHPYTCGTDSRHRPLVATRHGWRCADCDYRQGWAHGVTASTPEVHVAASFFAAAIAAAERAFGPRLCDPAGINRFAAALTEAERAFRALPADPNRPASPDPGVG